MPLRAPRRCACDARPSWGLPLGGVSHPKVDEAATRNIVDGGVVAVDRGAPADGRVAVEQVVHTQGKDDIAFGPRQGVVRLDIVIGRAGQAVSRGGVVRMVGHRAKPEVRQAVRRSVQKVGASLGHAMDIADGPGRVPPRPGPIDGERRLPRGFATVRLRLALERSLFDDRALGVLQQFRVLGQVRAMP